MVMISLQINKFLVSQIPERFCEEDPLIQHKKSYEKLYLQKYGKEWDGNILDINYLNDLLDSLKHLFETESIINPEIEKTQERID